MEKDKIVDIFYTFPDGRKSHNKYIAEYKAVGDCLAISVVHCEKFPIGGKEAPSLIHYEAERVFIKLDIPMYFYKCPECGFCISALVSDK